MSLTSDLEKFTHRSRGEKWLFLEAFLLLGVCRLLIVAAPFKQIIKILKLEEGECSPGGEASPLLLSAMGWAIKAAAPRTPWESVCLGQGLTGIIMLKRRGIPATLFLGVAKDLTGTDTMTAHAWLRSGNLIITGAGGHERYSVVSSFSSSCDAPKSDN